MTENAIQSLADHAVAAGTLSRSDADRMIAADVAALNAPDAPMTPSQTAQADDFMQRRAADLVSSGQMTQEQADAALKTWMGVAASPTQQQGDQQVNGPVADPFAGAQLDPGFGPPERPSEYRFDIPNPDVMTVQELGWAQDVFMTAKMPVGISQQIFSTVMQLAQQPMDAADIDLMAHKTTAELQQVYGANTEAAVALGRRFVLELDKARPGVKDLLNNSGAGSHPVIVRQIIEHAARVYGKR
ncbi:hypothetical protein A9O66_14410 [Paraburkholderia caribensis]|uniref:Uncharacterized protein n=2 Tax=Paraburkholderia caribensis TaxID=75105 RepID=A0A9Q6WM74_9BURK|nr:hypothetical protein A9O66_14410 [Paraburkholderia caribensis]